MGSAYSLPGSASPRACDFGRVGYERAQAQQSWAAKQGEDLTGHVVVVTGANRGLGLGVCRAFAARGVCARALLALCLSGPVSRAVVCHCRLLVRRGARHNASTGIQWLARTLLQVGPFTCFAATKRRASVLALMLLRAVATQR